VLLRPGTVARQHHFCCVTLAAYPILRRRTLRGAADEGTVRRSIRVPLTV
jgi:hypothetical protein